MKGESKLDKEKVFISYTTRNDYDIKWALWLDSVLKNIFTYETFIQEYDSATGGNFKAFMDDALKEASIVIGVVTESYMESANCREEWTNAERFIPVLFDDYKPRGLLKSSVYIDLYGKSEEDAIKELQSGLTKKERPEGVLPYPEWKSGNDVYQNKQSYPAFRTHAVHNLDRHNSYFSGREDILKEIRKEFTGMESVCFSVVELMGQGGFGKTQIAVEYAYRHMYDYDYILIINSESAARLENSYREIVSEVMSNEPGTDMSFTDIKFILQRLLRQKKLTYLSMIMPKGVPI
jgi:hypothetical protein